ncbi:hypothetical protein GCM10009670_22450 [Citricoccus alkalitolerans]
MANTNVTITALKEAEPQSHSAHAVTCFRFSGRSIGPASAMAVGASTALGAALAAVLAVDPAGPVPGGGPGSDGTGEEGVLMRGMLLLHGGRSVNKRDPTRRPNGRGAPAPRPTLGSASVHTSRP